MPLAAELLMPKLGLTMTEGRIARWAIAPGARFAAGQIVVEVETDKIINEIEAPFDGVLIEHIAPEGTTIPVGTPIARWQPNAGAAAVGPLASAREQPPTRPPAVAGGHMEHSSSGTRIIATPYARKLAARAGMPIATVPGSGPDGRIKAADIERAIRDKAAPELLASARESQRLQLAPHLPTARAISFVTCDIGVSRLREIEQRVLAATLAMQPDLRHYVTLACLRALAGANGNEPLRIALESGADDGRYFTFDANRSISLSALVALHADAAARQTLTTDAARFAQVVILAGNEASHTFAPAVAAGWAMTIGIGAVREVHRPDPAGFVRSAHEMTLALSYDANEIAHAGALDLVSTLKSLLEEPLGLLVQ